MVKPARPFASTALLCTLSLPAMAAGSPAPDTATSGRAAQAISTLRNSLLECSPALQQQSARASGYNARLEQTQSQRLPTFAVDAGGYLYDDGDSASPVNLSASMPITTFGRQEAAERLDYEVAYLEKMKISSDASELIQKLLELQIAIDQQQQDMAIINTTLASQRELQERIKRRLDTGLASPAELNSVASKISKLSVDYGTLHSEKGKLERELYALSCGRTELPLRYDQLQYKPEGLGSLEVANPKLQELARQIIVEQQRYQFTQVKSQPELGVEAVAPLDSSDDSRARIGLKLRYEYGNMGAAHAAEVEQQWAQIAVSKSAYAKYADQLMSDQQTLLENIKYFSRYMIPNQSQTIDSLEATLASKTRLFHGGRTGLFELLSAQDELMQAKLQLNEFKSRLAQFRVEAAENSGLYIE